MIPKWRVVGALLVSLTLSGCAQASPLPAAYCSLAAQAHVEGAAIAVFSGGAVSTIGCGKRDGAGEPVTAETVFEAASLSKPAFAYAVLELVQKGKLNLDVPLLKYLDRPYIHQDDPFFHKGGSETVLDPKLAGATARQVLSHTTGLPNWARHGALSFTGRPGRWQYSSEGYILLQQVIERITGQPLDRWMETTVFGPLGMGHSSFVWKPSFQSNAAAAFDRAGHPERANLYPRAVAAATLYTTLDDYGRFVQKLLDRDAVGKQMMEEQTMVDPPYGLAWGLGLGIGGVQPSPAYFHSGNNRGYKAFFLIEPDRQRGLLLLTNSDNGYRLIKPLVAETLHERLPVLDAPELPYPKN